MGPGWWADGVPAEAGGDFYDITHDGDLPMSATEPRTVLRRPDLPDAMQRLGKLITSSSPDAVVFSLRLPNVADGDPKYTLSIFCACKDIGLSVNEHGQVADGQGIRRSNSARHAKCGFGCVLQSTTDFGTDGAPYVGAARIVVKKLCLQHTGHVKRLRRTTSLSKAEADAVKMISGPSGGDRHTNRSAFHHLNAAPERKDNPITRNQLNNMIKKLKGSKAKSTALDDVYELVASLMFSGHGFGIELRGVTEATGATSATAIIARELDQPGKLFFVQDANMFEDTLDALRNEPGPVLGTDRCERRGVVGCCQWLLPTMSFVGRVM